MQQIKWMQSTATACRWFQFASPQALFYGCQSTPLISKAGNAPSIITCIRHLFFELQPQNVSQMNALKSFMQNQELVWRLPLAKMLLFLRVVSLLSVTDQLWWSFATLLSASSYDLLPVIIVEKSTFATYIIIIYIRRRHVYIYIYGKSRQKRRYRNGQNEL